MFWTVVIGGAIAWGWKYYYDHPEKIRTFKSPTQIEEEERAAAEEAAEPESKRKQKLKLREEKKLASMKTARR